MKWFDLRVGGVLDVLPTLPDRSVNCCVTSPPYWGLRSYLPEGHDDKHMEIGLEPTPEEYVAKMVAVFREVRRILRDDGTLWLNLGDSYASMKGAACGTDDKQPARRGWKRPQDSRIVGLKPKDLVGIPWRVAFALQADGWYLRQDIIWSKPNPMPESVRDRCTKSHEYIFLMSKSARYYYDAEAIAEDIASSSIARLSQDVASQAGSSRVPGKTNGPVKAVGGAYSFARTTRSPGVPGLPVQHRPDREPIEYRGRRNRRSVWTVSTKPFKKAHFATFPPDLIEPCILAGCPEGGVVLDPFIGSGTTAMVAIRNRRRCVGIELNPAYADMARRRASGAVLDRESDLFETPAILTP